MKKIMFGKDKKDLESVMKVSLIDYNCRENRMLENCNCRLSTTRLSEITKFGFESMLERLQLEEVVHNKIILQKQTKELPHLKLFPY